MAAPLERGPLSDVVDLRRRVASRALDVFRGWAYREIDVPLLDYFDALRTALDPDQVNRMFRFVDRDGNLLVLRADVTPAIAKIYANQLSGAPLPLRLCYANKVVRIERAFTREQIENYQIGIELIGASGPEPEIEVLLVALETLTAIGVDDFEIHLGNAVIVERLVALTGLRGPARAQLTAAIRERDPHAVHAMLNQAARDAGVDVDPSIAIALNAASQLCAGHEAVEALHDIEPRDEALSGAIDDLCALLDTLVRLGVGDRVHLDVGLGNENGYYTGTRFTLVSERVGRIIGGGGRYDELIGRFGAPTPAVGFSVSLEGILELIEGRGGLGDAPNHANPVELADDAVAAFSRALSRRRDGLVTRVDYPLGGRDA